MTPARKRLLTAALSLAILLAVWMSVDRRELLRSLAGIHIGWFALSLLFFLPQKALQAWRWRKMARTFCPISFRESLRLILAGDALNLVLPSKLGDLSKALFLRSQGRLPLSYGVNLVAYEKMLDMSALCLLLAIGVLGIKRFDAIGLLGLLGATAILAITAGVTIFPFIAPPAWIRRLELMQETGMRRRIARLLLGAAEVVRDLAGRRDTLWLIAALSVAIWILHLLQIYCFFLALRSPVPFGAAMALIPIAIFVGLLPVTIAGIGTRDAAFVFLFSPYQSAAAMAAVGLLTHLRYLVPGLAGLPFFNSYLRTIRLWQAEKSAPPETP